MFDNVVGDVEYQLKSWFVLKALFITILICWVYFLWSRRKFYLLSLKLPGPMSLPIIGNAIDMGAFGKGKDVTECVLNISKKYPTPFVLWAGLDFSLVIADPYDLEILLSNKISSYKDSRYEAFSLCVGPGLIAISGPVWKRHRQIIDPSFNSNAIRSYEPVNNKHSRHFVNSLMGFCGKGKVEVIRYCQRYMADVLMEGLFNIEMEYYKGDKDHLIDLAAEVTDIIYDRITKPWLKWEAVFNLSSYARRQNRLLNNYENYFHPMLKDKIKKCLELKKQSHRVENGDFNRKESLSSFEHLTDAMSNGSMTEEEVIAEFATLYNGGLETTFSHVGFFMLMMGMHKNVQDKLYEEIESVFGDDKSCDVFMDHLNKMPYLDMCIKEQIRMFPTGAIVTRIINEDFALKSKDIVIPAGTHIMISPYILHRNPKYWNEPDSYNPDRFLSEECKNVIRMLMHRFCLGCANALNFGIDALKIVGVHLLRNFEFRANLKFDQLKLSADIATRSAVGYEVFITKRSIKN